MVCRQLYQRQDTRYRALELSHRACVAGGDLRDRSAVLCVSLSSFLPSYHEGADARYPKMRTESTLFQAVRRFSPASSPCSQPSRGVNSLRTPVVSGLLTPALSLASGFAIGASIQIEVLDRDPLRFVEWRYGVSVWFATAVYVSFRHARCVD